MAHIRNEEIHLYTGFASNGNENFAAYEALKASGVPFRHLHYGDPHQHDEMIASISTWFKNDPSVGTITLPFVTYTEVYEVTDPVSRVAKIVIGQADIESTDWVALNSFTG